MGDPVVEQPPARLEQARQTPGVLVDSSLAHVLHHANAGYGIERTILDVAIIEHPMDPMIEPRLAYPLPGQTGLLLRERDPDRADTVAPGGMDDEAAPAAADVEHPLSRLEPKLLTGEFQLGPLRRFQRGAVREKKAQL